MSKVLLALACVVAGVASTQVTFQDVSAAKGIQGREWMDDWRPDQNSYWGNTVADMNNDGYYDLLLSNHQDGAEFYWGGPDGFTYVNTLTRRRDSHGTAAFDWDEDGLAEFIIGRGGANGADPGPAFYYDVSRSTNGGLPTVRRMTDEAARDVGLIDHVRARSMAFYDIDGDGRRDLLMVNRHKLDHEDSHIIYRNRGPSDFELITDIGFQKPRAAWFVLMDIDGNNFLDVILMTWSGVQIWMGYGDFKYVQEDWRLPGAASLSASRSGAEIDLDNDGRMEFYLCRGDKNRPADDKLYKVVDGIFVDISADWNIPTGGRHVHITSADFNNDGLVDLMISRSTWYLEDRLEDLLLLNDGSTLIAQDPELTGLAAPETFEDGDNAAAFDYNNDGWIDLLVKAKYGPWRLYQNVGAANFPGNNWFTLWLGRPRMGADDVRWDKDSMGALVRLQCGTKIHTQRVGTNGGSHSQCNLDRLTFGVGTCDKVRLIKMNYIGGVRVNRWGGKVNRLIRIGHLNCPGPRCRRVPGECHRTCQYRLCERNMWRGNTWFCKVY